jgi:hypothetical protein
MGNNWATKTRRHKKETRSMKDLSHRMRFLRSRTNAHSDPKIQALIAETQAAMDARIRDLQDELGSELSEYDVVINREGPPR